MRVRAWAAAAAAAVVLAGCSGEEPTSPTGKEPTSEADIGSTGAPAGPAQVKVGQPYRYTDGLEVSVTRMRAASKAQVDPVLYDHPASWKGVLVDVTIRNGTKAPVTTDWPVTVTAGPNDSAGDLVTYEGPGSVAGASWLGDAPILAGRTRRLTAAIAVESASLIVITLGSNDGSRPDVIVTGDAS